MRTYILKNYINLSHDTTIIGHHGSIHFKNFFITLGLTVLLWILYSISQYFFPSLSFITWVIGWLWVIIYINFILTFLNHYLDAIIITKEGISIFQREKILNYTLQHCHRDNIESITQSQSSLSDRIFGKGEVNITLDHGVNTQFQYVENPRNIASLLWSKKTQFESKSSPNINTPWLYDGWWHEKFDILVETLGEVIKEYMDKDRTKGHNPDKRSM